MRLCAICSEHAVAFVKTSTGYGFVKRPDGLYTYAGATDHDLVLMRRASAPSVQVKAAGGVRTLDDLLRVRVGRHPRRRHGHRGDPRRGAAARALLEGRIEPRRHGEHGDRRDYPIIRSALGNLRRFVR